MMINKTIFGILLLSFLFLFVTSVSAYTIKIPACTSTLNDSCINYTTVSAITNAPQAIMYLGADGNFYLTNDTQIQYTIVNNYTNYTYPTYFNYTNITQNITNYYSYNLTNGSNLTIYQNVTANDSIIRAWVASLNLSIFNSTVYNRTEADSIFAFKSDLTSLQNALASYATKSDISALDMKFSPLLYINFSGMNGTSINLKAIQDHIDNSTGDFSMTWKVIIIINCILIVILILLIAKNMMTE